MTARLFYWIHHTGTYDGNSGVQRVTRALAAALAALRTAAARAKHGLRRR